MKLTLLTIVLAMISARVIAGITDPIADFEARAEAGSKVALTSSDVICYWLGDLAGNGKKAFFISSKEDYDEDQSHNQWQTWEVYLPNDHGGYTLCAATSDDEPGNYYPQVDVDDFFIGYISELGKRGLVTMQTDQAWHDRPTVARIYAYTLEGDHLKRTKLAEYNSEKKDSPIYNKYLSDARRTKVQLKEVTP